MKGLFTLVSVLCVIQSFALDVTLFINRDTLSTNGVNIAACRFNESAEFNRVNANLSVAIGELVIVEIVNNDNADHTFSIDGILESENAIAAQSTTTFELVFNSAGGHRFYSDMPYGQIIGASGIITVGYESSTLYSWNLMDTEDTASHALSNGEINFLPGDYIPELFFINGYAFPEILEQENTSPTVILNQEVIITVANSGTMDHMLHWHGFHVEILHSNVQPERIGWLKDTFPVKKGDVIIMRLMPDQLGIYPVHNHNLRAVTNLGLYPGGMLTRITVVE